jgi:predicted flap endonuclease-1-like 5' DNA nuclease
VTPFGFLLGEAPEPLIPSSAVSALAAIIKAPPSPAQNPVPVPAATPAPLPTLPPVSVIPTVLPEFDPALGLVYKITPPDTDDLTRIKGIASVLEKRLHDLGVYTWRQIASWEERHIREFSNRLAFKDRIVREKWVEQARSLNEARQLI